MSEHANETMTAAEFREEQAESMSEEAIHKAVIDYADRLHRMGQRPGLRLLFHVPNGGRMPKGSAGKMKGFGQRKGVPDLILPIQRISGHDSPHERIRYGGLCLELKSANGYLRPEQAWWLKRLREQCYAVAVARSVEEAIACLTDYLDGEHEPQDLPLDRAEAPDHV